VGIYRPSFLMAGYMCETPFWHHCYRRGWFGAQRISLAAGLGDRGGCAAISSASPLSDPDRACGTLAFLCLAQLVVCPAYSLLPHWQASVDVLQLTLAHGTFGVWSVFGWSFMAAQQPE